MCLVLARKKYWRPEADLLVYVMKDARLNTASRGFNASGASVSLPHFPRQSMLWFRRLKKSPQPSPHPVSSEPPSRIGAIPPSINAGLDSDVQSQGAIRSVESRNRWGDLTIATEPNDGEYSQTVPRDGKDQRSQAPSTSDSKPGYKDDVTRECALPLAGSADVYALDGQYTNENRNKKPH